MPGEVTESVLIAADVVRPILGTEDQVVVDKEKRVFLVRDMVCIAEATEDGVHVREIVDSDGLVRLSRISIVHLLGVYDEVHRKVKRYTITIGVIYDRATVPKHMERDLERNVNSAIQQGLLADCDEGAEVKGHSVEVKEEI